MERDEVATDNRRGPERALGDLFVRLSQMSQLDLRRVRIAWDTQSASRRSEIWRRAQRVVDAGGRAHLVKESRERLASWANDFATGRTGTPEDASWIDIDRLDARAAAMPAVLDAVVSIVAADGLDEVDRTFLSTPLRSGYGSRVAPRRLRRTRTAPGLSGLDA